MRTALKATLLPLRTMAALTAACIQVKAWAMLALLTLRALWAWVGHFLKVDGVIDKDRLIKAKGG